MGKDADSVMTTNMMDVMAKPEVVETRDGGGWALFDAEVERFGEVAIQDVNMLGVDAIGQLTSRLVTHEAMIIDRQYVDISSAKKSLEKIFSTLDSVIQKADEKVLHSAMFSAGKATEISTHFQGMYDVWRSLLDQNEKRGLEEEWSHKTHDEFLAKFTQIMEKVGLRLPSLPMDLSIRNKLQQLPVKLNNTAVYT